MSFINDIKKPFNLLMLLLAVCAITIAIMVYFWSTKSSEISYCIEPTTKIVDSKLKGSKLSVFDDNNKEIKSDIYSTSVIIWNSGDLPIKTEDIRIIPSIIFSGISQLLSIPTIKESEPNISEFRLIKDSTKSKRFELIWKHFDPNKAFRINILYTNKNENIYDVKFNGNILGINGFQKVEYYRKDNKTFNILSLVSLLLIGGSVIFLTPIDVGVRESQNRIINHFAANEKLYIVIFSILASIGMVGLTYALFFIQPDIPAF